jgi:hypothetical protein
MTAADQLAKTLATACRIDRSCHSSDEDWPRPRCYSIIAIG